MPGITPVQSEGRGLEPEEPQGHRVTAEPIDRRRAYLSARIGFKYYHGELGSQPEGTSKVGVGRISVI